MSDKSKVTRAFIAHLHTDRRSSVSFHRRQHLTIARIHKATRFRTSLTSGRISNASKFAPVLDPRRVVVVVVTTQEEGLNKLFCGVYW